MPSTAARTDQVAWTRLTDGDGHPLDLLHARILRQHYAPHLHEQFAVGVCQDGLEVIRYRRTQYRTGPGALVVLEPGEAHTGGPALATGFSYRAMYPRGALLLEASGGTPHFPEPVIHDPALASALTALHSAMTSGLEPLAAESGLTWLLGHLVRRHAAPARPSVAVRGTDRIAERVMAQLADRMTHPPTLAEIAQDLGLSRYQTLRAFRERVGMPPYAWLAQHRVTRARRLLEAGARPAEVAAAVGFADQAHLTRWFRRVVGVTPGAYRESTARYRTRVDGGRNSVQDVSGATAHADPG
ncbi:AraC family transcriptional regulator [Wenjunlia vitaminophila]|uniref:AraC family transcriptional regulator n=1 Tax=Wenjunlia vitaminophila TaxID=76728 RepID=A0A0T6LN39_WENVI|nr:AraC family transcriptional regulator [Wenjunlia vitaminophila]KRV47514.1 AraC family transcriptional regulator [Wenjunlia vitaminophila]